MNAVNMCVIAQIESSCGVKFEPFEPEIKKKFYFDVNYGT